ncbi:putative glycoside hydrolase [Peribacillus kribbensis]|uniref:putative glycoside hydrolase n=1 Tax=Peribacillus kribbensis TaxID=356658 RepID=UPI0006866A88
MSPAWGEETSKNGQEAKLGGYKKELPDNLPRFTYHSGLSFTYPNAVRGIYVSGNIAGAERFNELLKLVDSTDLNAMVIDIKNDSGNLTYKPGSTSPYQNISQKYIRDPKSLLKTLEQRKIYPIARVVVFKDTELAHLKPEWSYMDGKSVWKNGKGDSFVNPFLKEVWDYNVGVAIEAAKMGFQEIQFDYVRFPEGFEKRDSQLKYSQGDYQHEKLGNVQKRVKAVSDFVAYAREKLKPYDVKVSVDIFGYTATLPEAPGIGQNFSKISENVDAISSMIYPSHWTSYFGIDNPDLEPYKIVSAYSQLEKKKLEELKTPPISRPWIQDFTASWLGQGHYKPYGKAEVEAQIKALKNNGISEFLLWNAGSRYTSNVDYTP